MELRLQNNQEMVQVFYKNTTDTPAPLYIPNCGTSCPLHLMYSLYNDVLPGDFDDECRLSLLSMTYEEAELSSAMGM